MNHHAQRGFTLLELMAALAIGMLMLLGLTSMLDMSLQDVKGQSAGQYQAQFVAAATRYLADQYTTLLPVPAGPLTQTTVTLGQLRGAGLLSANFPATNVYGQTPCMLLNKPGAGQIDALIVTEGGTLIPEADISYLAANAGAGGGAITYAVPGDNTSGTVARGVYGGWVLTNAQLGLFTANNCSGAAADLGHLANALFFGGGGQVQNDFLYRTPVGGNTQFNRMDTPIGMGGAAINRVAGTACGTAPAIAMNASGQLLTCDVPNNKWANPVDTYWKEPVANYAALATVAGPRQGDVYMTTDLGRAYMRDGVGGWQPLALDQNGHLTMEGDLTANGPTSSIFATTNINAGQDLNAVRDIIAARNLVANQDVLATRDVLASRDIHADSGRVSAQKVEASVSMMSRFYSISSVHLAGDPCNYYSGPDYISPWGSVTMDPNGITMFCKSSIPNPPPSPTPADNPSGMYVYQNNTTTPP
ncbi:shufflon system plasmid conjugative transfer pilus tip adhesin PilV [Actimicrobium antarcticum]|uniref:Bacterial shufflon protein N-terminal domain-containing protein n=1 Tax=Actimicrobium antarcticum TaxID=1051899 RepID=A0ABP7T9R5_9BURK